MRKKKEDKLPPLCVAVKYVRDQFDESQERFGRRIGAALMTVSQFENGREPRDPRILLNLAKVSEEIAQLPSEDEKTRTFESVFENKDELVMTGRYANRLFREAYADYERTTQTDRTIGELQSTAQPGFRSMREWRLSCAARLAALYFPEQVIVAMEKAAGPALSLVDEVLSGADENRINYAQFERDIFALADRRALLQIKQGRKKQ